MRLIGSYYPFLHITNPEFIDKLNNIGFKRCYKGINPKYIVAYKDRSYALYEDITRLDDIFISFGSDIDSFLEFAKQHAK